MKATAEEIVASLEVPALTDELLATAEQKLEELKDKMKPYAEAGNEQGTAANGQTAGAEPTIEEVD